MRFSLFWQFPCPPPHHPPSYPPFPCSTQRGCLSHLKKLLLCGGFRSTPPSFWLLSPAFSHPSLLIPSLPFLSLSFSLSILIPPSILLLPSASSCYTSVYNTVLQCLCLQSFPVIASPNLPSFLLDLFPSLVTPFLCLSAHRNGMGSGRRKKERNSSDGEKQPCVIWPHVSLQHGGPPDVEKALCPVLWEHWFIFLLFVIENNWMPFYGKCYIF